MATRLYVTSDETAVFDPTTRRGAWDKTTGNVVVERLATTKFGRGFSNGNSENSATNNFDVLFAVLVTEPLKKSLTISGTLDAVLLVAETNADANDVLHIHAWVTQGDTGNLRGTLINDFVDTTEWAVSTSLTNFTGLVMPQQTVSPVTVQVGDRIVIEVGYQAQNTHTTSRSGGMIFGGRSSTDADGTESAVAPSTNAVPWFEFSANMTFGSTYLYTTADAAPVTPTANRGTWDVDNKLDRSFARTVGSSALESRAVAETSATNPTDGLTHRFVSPQLRAQTIAADTLWFMINQTESATDADAFAKYHLYVMASDGSVRGTLVANYVGATELSTLSGMTLYSIAISSLAVNDGDRLVLEVGGRFTNVTVVSKSVTTYAEGLGASGSGSLGTSGPTSNGANAGWVRFSQTLLWLSDALSGIRSQVVAAG